MKKFTWMALVLMAAASAWAGEMPGYTPPKTSAELERIKSLEGRWEGQSMEKGQENKTVIVDYRVTAGGSAVEEKLDSGTAHEMVSMYHDVNGKLAMEHYCLLGNQPQLELKSSTATKLVLVESVASAAALNGQMRMRDLVIEWTDKGGVMQTWTAYGADGKAMPSTVFKLQKYDLAAVRAKRREMAAAAVAAAQKTEGKKEDKKEIKKEEKKEVKKAETKEAPKTEAKETLKTEIKEAAEEAVKEGEKINVD